MTASRVNIYFERLKHTMHIRLLPEHMIRWTQRPAEAAVSLFLVSKCAAGTCCPPLYLEDCRWARGQHRHKTADVDRSLSYSQTFLLILAHFDAPVLILDTGHCLHLSQALVLVPIRGHSITVLLTNCFFSFSDVFWTHNDGRQNYMSTCLFNGSIVRSSSHV